MSYSRKMLAQLCLILPLFALLLVGLPFGAQGAGEINWEYGVTAMGKQQTEAMTVDSQGNTILTGFSEASSTDFFTAKVKADGSGLAWPAVSFDLAGGLDVAKAVAVDGNDDIVVTGYAHNGSNYDIQTIKYSGADGSVIWQHTFDSPAHGDDFATAIAVDSLNNVYVGGYGQGSSGKNDFIILKYAPSGPNPDGTPKWQVTYNGPADGHDMITAIAAGTDGLAITGKSQNATPDYDCLTLKLGFDGTFIWPQPQRYTDTGDGEGRAVVMDAAGNVLMTGVAFGYVSPGSKQDLFTIKYAGGDGTPVWVNAVDRGYDDAGRALHVDESGDVYVVGTTFSLTSATDILTLKYNSAGMEQWREPYNSANGNTEVGVAVVAVAEGDLFIGGYSNDDASGHDRLLLLKYRKDGTFLWDRFFVGNNEDNRLSGLEISPNGDILVGGWSERGSAGASDYDYYVTSYDSGALNPPTDLTAETVTDAEIALSWTDNSLNEDNFVLERKICTEAIYDSVTVLPPGIGTGTMSYNSIGLTPDTRYCYRVKATNSTDGSSHYSNVADAKTTVVSYAPPSWLYQFNGADNGDDYPEAIAVGPDNNLVVVGSTFKVNGSFDYHTVKINSSTRDAMWSANYGDPDHEPDYATSVAIDSANRVVVTGYASLYGGGGGNTNDLYTLAYPAAGPAGKDGFGNDVALWDDQYDGPGGGDDRSIAVGVATDGSDNSVVIGYGKNAKATPDDDIYVLKYGPDGTRLWAALPFDGGGNDYPEAVAFASGNIFVVGKTHNGTDYDFFVAKYDGGSGALVWQGAPHDLAVNGDDYARDVAVDSAGNIYVTGYAVNVSGDGDFYTVKYAPSGAISWQRSFDTGGVYDQAAAIEVDPFNDDVLVAGTSFIDAGNHDFRLIRYDAAGNIVWNKTLDQPDSDDALVAMGMDGSGMVTLTGSSRNVSGNDILAVKYNEAGTVIGASVFNGAAGGYDSPVGIAVNALGDAYVAGWTINTANNADLVVFKVDADVLQAPHPFSSSSLYTSASLNWSDNALDEDGYRVERFVGSCADATEEDWDLINVLGAGITSYADSGLDIGATYCYRVQAVSTRGDVSRWIEDEVTTVAPPAPAPFSGSVKDTNRILLSWTDKTSGEVNFLLERCTELNCVFPSPGDPAYVAFTPSASTTSYTDSSVCAGEFYRYRIAAKGSDWMSPYADPIPIQNASIVTPSNPVASRVDEEKIRLTWQDHTSDETGFEVEHCVEGNCTTTTVPANRTYFDHTGLLANKTYSYRVRAIKTGACGWPSPYTAPVSAITTLLSPDSLAAMRLNEAQIHLTWVDRTSHESSFEIKRCVDGDCSTFSRPANSTSYDDPDLTTDKSYSYWIRAVKTETNPWTSEYGNLAVASTSLIAPGSPVLSRTDTTRAEFSWSNETATETAFVVERCSGSGTACDQDVAFDYRPPGLAAGATSFSDATVCADQAYTYRVKAERRDASLVLIWETGWTGALLAAVTPPAPTGLEANRVSEVEIALSWQDQSNDETGFEIFRCEEESCSPLVLHDTVTAGQTSYSDTDLNPDSVYSYQVRAYKTAGCPWWSTFSNAVSAPTTILAPDGGVAAEAGTVQIELYWNDRTASETGFIIESCPGNGTTCDEDTEYHYLDTASANATGYSDVSRCPESTVSYRVCAARGGTCLSTWTELGAATTLGVETPSFSATVTSESQVSISWNDTINDEDEYVLQRCTGDATACTEDADFTSELMRPAGAWSAGRVLFYKMSETSWSGGGAVRDSSGSGNHGTAYNQAAPVAGGKYGWGGSFDGASDYISTPLNIDQGSGSAGATFEAWVRPNQGNSSNYRYVISTDNGGYDWGFFQRYSRWWVSTGTEHYDTGISAPEGVWQHIAVVFLPGVGIKFYKDGALAELIPASSLGFDTSDANVNIGRQGNYTGNDFWGSIDEVAIFARPLSAAVVADLYREQVADFSYSDSGLGPSTAYTYRLTAANEGNACPWSASSSQTVTTPAQAAPTGLIVNPVYTTRIDLSWTDQTSSETGFEIERCSGAGCSNYTPLPTLGANDTSYSDTNLCAGNSYSYRVRAVRTADPSWNPTSWVAGSGSTEASNPPGSFTATPASESTINLSWTDTNGDETSYVLKRCDADAASCVDDADFTVTLKTVAGGNLGTMTHTDSDLATGSVHTYRVQGVKTGACGWPKESKQTVSTLSPPAPSNLQTVAVSTNQVNVTWIDNTTTETGFLLQRCDKAQADCADEDFYDLAPLGVNVESYSDTEVCRGDVYTYRIQALKTTAPPWATDWAVEEGSVVSRVAPVNFQLSLTSETDTTMSWEGTIPEASAFILDRCTGSVTACSQLDAVYETLDTLSIDTLLQYLMDEAAWSGVPGEVTDASGQGRHGQAYGGANTVSGGKYSRAGNFDGVNDYVATPLNIDQSQDSSGVTVEAWVYPAGDAMDTPYYVFSTGDKAWGLFGKKTEVCDYWCETNRQWYISTGDSEYQTSSTYLLNEWQHVALVFPPGESIKFYINGALVAEIPAGNIGYGTADTNLFLGRKGTGGGFFAGRLDHVIVFERSLGAAEIARHAEQAPLVYAAEDGGLALGTTYTYRVRSHYDAPGDACDWDSAPALAEVTTPLPDAPTGLVVAETLTTRVGLTWTDNTATEEAFRVERCNGDLAVCCPDGTCDDNDDGRFAVVVTALPADSTAYSDVTPCYGQPYTYRVRAEGIAAGVPWQTGWDQATATTMTPTSPTDFTLEVVSDGEMRATWSETTIDEDHYAVEWCEGDYATCSAGGAVFNSADVPVVAEFLVYYPMDDATWSGAAGEVTDATGLGHAGTAVGAVTVADGYLGRAGSFDGVDDYINTSLNIDQSATSPGVTMSAWVYITEESDGSQYIFSTGNNNWGLYAYKYTDCVWGCVDPVRYWRITTGNQWLDTPVNYVPNRWYHVDVVFHPGVGIKFYLDGELAKEYSAGYLAYSTDDTGLVIGALDATHHHLGGYIDEAGVVNGPLSGTQIRNHYQARPLFNEHTFGGLKAETEYSARVKAVKNSDCPWEKKTDLLVRTTSGIVPPDGLVIVSFDSGQVELTWNDTTGSETGFRIERCVGDSCDFSAADAIAAPANATSYADASGCNSVPYRYRIRAEKEGDTLNPDSWSTAWAAPTAAVTKPDLGTPTGLTAVSVDSSRVDLDWNDNSVVEAGYIVERRCTTVGCGDFAPVDPVDAGVTHYEDSSVAAGMGYSYRVRVYKNIDCLVENDYSGVASVLVEPVALDYNLRATALNSRMIRLDWDDIFDGESGYEAEVQIWNGEWINIAVTAADGMTFVDTRGLDPANSYSYRVRAFHGESKAPYSTAVTKSTDPLSAGDGTCPPAQ